jgi:hypothetical protein
VVNLATLKDEFHTLVKYIEHKILEQNNKKLEAQWWEECEMRIFEYVDNKMHNFDVVVALEIERRKWEWHPFFDIFTIVHALKALAPNFPWTHNNNEAITICDGIYNLERVGMFYPIPWCVKFLRLYTFSKGLHIPLVHPLRGATKKPMDNGFHGLFDQQNTKLLHPLCLYLQ